MKIGILGAGNMGTTLARAFLRAGHEVRLANSRGPASLAFLVNELGEGASAGTPEDLAAFADLLVIATRWDQTPAAAENLGDVKGKIVIDPTNNRVGPRPKDLIDLGGRTSSEVVADLLPGARLVKAFNHQPIPSLDHLRPPPSPDPFVLFIAGDDDGAKRVVAQLIRDMGGEPIDTGTLIEGSRLQGHGGPLTGHGRLLRLSEAKKLLRTLEPQYLRPTAGGKEL